MGTANTIPFLDLVSPHREMEKELVGIFRQALRTAAFIGGPMVEQFEKAFASFCTTTHCVGVSSGTDALRCALIACGVKHGDVVVTVPNTFIATTEAISQAGAMPEFVDVDELTCNMDPIKLDAYLREQCSISSSGRVFSRRSGRPVTAVVPVHLYGQMTKMDPILELAEKYGLMVIEDACQAHGAEYLSSKLGRWRRAGSLGRAAAFSFYPGKNLGACGEAGAVTTDDEEVAGKIKMLRDHGQTEKYYHDLEGYNGRLDAIQAGILHAKLFELPKWTAQRRRCANVYDELLGSEGTVRVPYQPTWSRSVYHLYVIRTRDRGALVEQLKTSGIGTGVHYPIPLHLQKAYRLLHYARGSFPVTEKLAAEIVSLPLYPQLSEDQQVTIAKEIQRFSLGRHVMERDRTLAAKGSDIQRTA